MHIGPAVVHRFAPKRPDPGFTTRRPNASLPRTPGKTDHLNAWTVAWTGMRSHLSAWTDAWTGMRSHLNAWTDAWTGMLPLSVV